MNKKLLTPKIIHWPESLRYGLQYEVQCTLGYVVDWMTEDGKKKRLTIRRRYRFKSGHIEDSYIVEVPFLIEYEKSPDDLSILNIIFYTSDFEAKKLFDNAKTDTPLEEAILPDEHPSREDMRAIISLLSPEA